MIKYIEYLFSFYLRKNQIIFPFVPCLFFQMSFSNPSWPRIFKSFFKPNPPPLKPSFSLRPLPLFGRETFPRVDKVFLESEARKETLSTLYYLVLFYYLDNLSRFTHFNTKHLSRFTHTNYHILPI
jgi:hypothetical protein